jgi:hypothetical protein
MNGDSSLLQATTQTTGAAIAMWLTLSSAATAQLSLRELQKLWEKEIVRNVPVPEPVHSGASVPPELQLERRWQAGPRCGANCAFALLRMQGKSVTIDEVAARVTTSGLGASLAELQDCLAHFGLHVKTVQATPGYLRKAALPCIAHLDFDDRPDSGHYLVICERDRNADNQFTVLDGTSGSVYYLDGGEFERSWSGYLIVLEPSWFESVLQWTFYLIVAGNVAWAGYLGGRWLVRWVRRG